MNAFDGMWSLVLAPWAMCFIVNAAAVVIGVRLWRNSRSRLVVFVATLFVAAATLGASLASITMAATAAGGLLTFGFFDVKLIAIATLVGTPVAIAILVRAAFRGSGAPPDRTA
jgi:hypothetical protein